MYVPNETPVKAGKSSVDVPVYGISPEDTPVIAGNVPSIVPANLSTAPIATPVIAGSVPADVPCNEIQPLAEPIIVGRSPPIVPTTPPLKTGTINGIDMNDCLASSCLISILSALKRISVKNEPWAISSRVKVDPKASPR